MPDLPLGEAPEVLEACDAHGLALVPLVAPTTTPERMREIGAQARGFLYTVSVVGTTGEREALADRFAEVVARAKASTRGPGGARLRHRHARAGARGRRRGRRRGDRGHAPGARRGEAEDPAAAAAVVEGWPSPWRTRPAGGVGVGAVARIAPRMGLILTVTAGLIVWIVLWALGAKGFDAFLLAAAIILVGASLKILAGYLPGRRS